MKIKVGENWYDSDRQPIMLKLTQEEANIIGELRGEEVSVCVFPDGYPEASVKVFMGAIEEETFKLIQKQGA